MVDQRIPELRSTLETKVNENASLWAKQASQQLLAAIPSARQQLEDYADRQADAAIDQLDVVWEKEFREMLEENRDTVQLAIQQIKEDGKLSDDVVLVLEREMEEKMKVNILTVA
jgi:hypothetical protein